MCFFRGFLFVFQSPGIWAFSLREIAVFAVIWASQVFTKVTNPMIFFDQVEGEKFPNGVEINGGVS